MTYFVIFLIIVSLFKIFSKNIEFISKSARDFQDFQGGNQYNRPKNFEMSLLVLSSVVIKADGVVNETELNYVRDHFVKTYGKEKANQAFRQFKNVIQQQISTRQTCAEIGRFMPYQARVQLVKFLFDVAYCDDQVTPSEELEIRKIASYLLIGQTDYLSLRNVYFKGRSQREQQYTSTYSQSSDYEYEILGLSENASNDDIKKAYRNLVKKYHPDRLQNASKEAVVVATEKFQKIQGAYEKIKDRRGI